MTIVVIESGDIRREYDYYAEKELIDKKITSINKISNSNNKTQ